MSCLNFATRNQTFINHFLLPSVLNKCIASFNTSRSCLAYVKKQAGSPALISNEFSAPPRNINNEGEQFRYLLRNSSFINMGDPVNKIVKGKIFHTVQDDLYVDFGWKFYCVCPRPTKNGRLYVRGSVILLKIKDLELSTKFLGSEKDLTLLEADASIVRLIYSPAKLE